MKSIDKLNHIIHKGIYAYSQIKRSSNQAIYLQIDKQTNEAVNYEVFVIKKRVKPSISKSLNKVFPAKELYPKNKDFGYCAWSVYSYERALRIFNCLELFGRKDEKLLSSAIVLNLLDRRSERIA